MGTKTNDSRMKLILIVCAAVILLFSSGCRHNRREELITPVVTKDEKFTGFFSRDSGGVTGADGTISVPMPDGSSVFMMGDSFLGQVVDGKRDSSVRMINNTFVVVNPKQTGTVSLFGGTYDNPSALVVPEKNPGHFYWPGHGFVRDSIFHFFMSRFRFNGTGMWAFEFVNTDYFRYSWPDFKMLSVSSFDYSVQNHVHWGHAVLDEGDFIYVYGAKTDTSNRSNAHVCRMIMGSDGMPGKVDFFDGVGWSPDPLASRPMLGITSQISEQFSVFRYGEYYILLSQEKGIGTGEIYTYTSSAPSGPWNNKQMIYKTTETEKDRDIITYNAMAHPQYIENDELLICYNVNSLQIRKVFENAGNYRPVFLRVPLALILPVKNNK